MSGWQLNTPVAFIIFNRPDTTERVFTEIAKARPPKLLVVADGPRPGRPGEAEKCAQARAIIERVDWECKVLTNYSDVNLGCKNRVSSGLDWVFEQVPEAIILEDDCLPHPTFFRFCEELLAYYRDDKRIGLISGNNFQFGRKRGEASYYFSRYNHIWGWASWSRAWKHFDKDAKIWPLMHDGGYLNYSCIKSSERKHWAKAFKSVYESHIDTWDYQWTLALWSQHMLSVLPNVNLVSNIGFGTDATHTKHRSIYSDLVTDEMMFPIQHPMVCIPDFEADKYTAHDMFSDSVLKSLLRRINNLFRKGC